MTMTNQMGSLAAGTVLRGNYEYQIVREIGRGAMAVVYLARQLNLDRLVALKVLSAELSSNKEFVKRFFNEVRTAAALSHPHIIQAYDAGVAEGDVYYFAMEYVDGETLLNRVRSSGRLSTEVALEYGLEIAHALNYGWQRQRLTHGDIKPENIMVTADNQAKLADFGLAKVSGHDYEGSEVMLTPHYAAPELIAGELSKDDCRADIYAFGASLYHLLSGTTPYPGDNGHEVMQMHLNEPLEALKVRCPEVPGFVSDFIGSLMEKEAGQRPQSWQAVLTGLQLCQERLSKTREKLSGGRKVRLNLPAAERRGPVVPARAAGVSGGTAGDGSVAARSRQNSRANLLWMLAMLFGIVLLLVLGFLYMQKKNRSGAAIPEAVVETVAAPGILPENVTPVAANAQTPPAAGSTSSLNDGTAGAATATTGVQAVETAAPTTLPAPAAETAPAEPVAAAETAPEEPVAAAEAAPAEPVAAAEPEADPVGVLLPDYSLPVPEGQEQVAERLDWLVLLQSLQIVPDRASSAEPLMRRVGEWQKERSLSPAGADLAQFLREVAIPRLDEASSRLVLRKESLRGKTIQSTQAGQAVYRVHDVTVSGMLLDKEIGDKGYMRMELGWGRLAGERYLDSIYLQAFGDSSDAADQQCLLSRLLFTGRPDVMEKLLSRQPGLGERANWQLLAQMLQVLVQNPLVVSKFGELRQAMADGARSQVGRLADEILRLPNVLPEGRTWCQSILAASGGYVRDIRGGQLIREAGEYLESRPVEAYCRLLAAQNLFVGRYPERTALEASLRQCLERLAAQGWAVGAGGQLPFVGWRPPLPVPVWGYLETTAATEKRERRSGAAAEVQGRALLNHVEAGNWLAGREAAVALASARLRRDDFAAEWQFPLAYAAFLLDLRYMDSLDRVLAFLRETPNYLPGDATRPAAVARILEGALFCRSRQALHVLPGVVRQDPDPGLSVEESFRLACRLAVVHRESGADGLLVGLWPLLRRGLPDGSAALIDWLQAQQDQGGAPAALPAALPERIEPELLLLLATLAPENAFPAAGDAWMLAQMRGEWRGWPLVGGEAVFTWLLRRLGSELRRGDVWTAQALVQQVAATEMPALTAYQSRLLLLRAGLLTLGGGSGGWLDAREGLRANGAASEGERQLPGRDLTVGKLPAGSPTGFYQGWLQYCRSLAMAAAVAAPAELNAEDLLSAEAELGRALTALPALLAAAPPRRLPVP